MSLSRGQINDAYQATLGREPTHDEAMSAMGRGDLEGDPGKFQLIRELGGAPDVGAGEPFAFDWDIEVQRAYEKLKPYYKQMLDYAGGDLDLAKRMIKFEYQQGLRETRSTYELAAREQAITFPAEEERLWTGMGRRGLIGAATIAEPGRGLVGKEAERLKESQAIRREAIERALQEKELRLTTGRGFGLERAETGFGREKISLAQAQEREAAEMAGAKFGRGLSIAQMEESRRQAQASQRLTQEQFEWQKRMAEQYGYTI